MTAILTAAITLTLGLTETWETPTPDRHIDGLATFYAPEVMARVAVNRGLVRYPGEFPEWLAERGYVCAIALNRRADLGRTAWLQRDSHILGPCYVADCAALHHYQRRIDQGRVVEVSWLTAQAWNMLGPVSVRVMFANPHLHRVKVYEPQ